MNSLPLVSVILAVYNGEKYIKETVESILSQRYENFELIIVVNCTNDNTIETLKDLNDPRISIYETNICQLNFNLNFALSKAKGEFIARIDADDIMVEDRLSKQIGYMKHYDVVGSNLEYIDEFSKPIRFKKCPEVDQEIRNQIYLKGTIAHPSVMYKKELILKNSAYMGGKMSEDYDLWLRLMRDKSVKFYNIQENLTQYRIHASQIKGNKYAYAEVAGYFLREALHQKSIRLFVGCLVNIGKYIFK